MDNKVITTILITLIFLVLLFVVIFSMFSQGESNKKVICRDPNCFEENFANCKPAIWNSSLENSGGSSFEILGKKDGKCLLKQTLYLFEEGYTLEQVCRVDNSLGIDTVLTDINLEDCEGSLTDHFRDLRNIVYNKVTYVAS